MTTPETPPSARTARRATPKNWPPATAPQPQTQKYSGKTLSNYIWTVFFNLTLIVGVIAWGWPAGNVLALFWAENFILGLFTQVRIWTAHEPTKRVPTTLFFLAHYGIFWTVHGVFALSVAFAIGFEPSFASLGIPLILLVLRYTNELVTVWFLGGQRMSMTPEQCMWKPYPRVIILHVTTLLAFGYSMTSATKSHSPGGVLDVLNSVFKTFGIEPTPGVVTVTLLVLIKLIAEVFIDLSARINRSASEAATIG